MKHKTINLETFLEGLPETAAANARAAAARIDELERAAQRIGKSDRQYVMAFAGAGVLAQARSGAEPSAARSVLNPARAIEEECRVAA